MAETFAQSPIGIWRFERLPKAHSTRILTIVSCDPPPVFIHLMYKICQKNYRLKIHSNYFQYNAH